MIIPTRKESEAWSLAHQLFSVPFYLGDKNLLSETLEPFAFSGNWKKQAKTKRRGNRSRISHRKEGNNTQGNVMQEIAHYHLELPTDESSREFGGAAAASVRNFWCLDPILYTRLNVIPGTSKNPNCHLSLVLGWWTQLLTSMG